MRLLVLAALTLLPSLAVGQATPAPTTVNRIAFVPVTPLVTIGGAVEDRTRVAQVLDSTRATAGLLLRSPSSFASPGRDRRRFAAIVPPAFTLVDNSGVPYSANDGALWAGRGTNARAIGGLQVAVGPVRLVVAPELVYSANQGYEAFMRVPRAPPTLSFYANPWHVGPDFIDNPVRFGEGQLRRVYPGQSSLILGIGSAEVGVATENQWWGPAVRNALIMSNNAPGFPHLFVRTAAPLATRLGAFEWRWLVGGLRESEYFDTNPDNDLRSISLLGLTWQPRWEKGLTLGAARAVFAPASSWGSAAGDFAQVFANVGAPSGNDDATRDQLFSLFFRWVFPADGFEAYAEWARAEQPTSLRDFLVSPNHSQAYTLGLQWVGDELALRWRNATGRFRVRAEMTSLEQSTSFRYRPIGTWYTSPRVIQGYTNRGQALGAAIGPGSSSQYLEVGYLAPSWQVGLFAERVRWMEDAHSEDPGSSWCNHDVSVLPGLSAAARTRAGTLSASYSSGWRLNTYFLAQEGFNCPGARGLDVRNKTLSISYSPELW